MHIRTTALQPFHETDRRLHEGLRQASLQQSANQFVREADEIFPSGVDWLLNYNGKASKVMLPDFY